MYSFHLHFFYFITVFFIKGKNGNYLNLHFHIRDNVKLNGKKSKHNSSLRISMAVSEFLYFFPSSMKNE